MATPSLVLVPVAALALFASGTALAQPGTTPPSVAAQPQPGTAPASASPPASGQGSTPTTTSTTQGGPSTPAQPSRPMAGYSFGDGKNATLKRAPVYRTHAVGPVVSFPAFAEGEKGDSRLTVQLSSAVPFEQQVGAGFIVYRLKGAHVARSNDTNPLVAVHFNTPLAIARLRNVGKDVELRVELRANVTPAAHVEALAAAAPVPTPAPPPKGTRARALKHAEPVATSQLVIDFPAGNYLETETSLK